MIATSCQDRFIRLYDNEGTLLAQVSGHSELVTSLCFSKDLTRLITVGGDGCIFVWCLSADLIDLISRRYDQVQDSLLLKKTQTATHTIVKSLPGKVQKSQEKYFVNQSLIPHWAKLKLGLNCPSPSQTQKLKLGSWSKEISTYKSLAGSSYV